MGTPVSRWLFDLTSAAIGRRGHANVSAVRRDIAELDRLLTKVRTEPVERKFNVIGLRAVVAEQLRFEDQQNRLMRWLIDNESTAGYRQR